MTLRRLGIAEVKRDFADVLDAVRHRGERFVIERRGTPVAALVPIKDLERLDEDGTAGFLTLVGAIEGGDDLADILDETVRERARAQQHDEAPTLPA